MRIIKKTILFAPETFNLAETTRSIEVAKECSEYFHCIFIGYSRKYAYLIENANFEFIHLEPVLSEDDITQLMKVDQMKGIKHPFTYKHLKKRIENEKRIINDYDPEVVVIGTTFSMFISARACRKPLVYIKPLAYTRTFLLKGHLELPHIINKPFVPKKFTMNLYKKIALSITYKPKSFSKLAKEEGVRLPKYTIDALDADYNLITTIPEISGVDNLPANYKYIGPVYAKLDVPIPSFLYSLPSNQPVIYFAMGSSGSKEIVMKFLHILKELPVTVICPMKKILASGDNDFSSNKNIIICDLLPAHKLGNIIDLSIIHGGEGTVQTACLSGKPFLALGLQAEQNANINECVLFGNALALKRKDITTQKIGELIDFSLTNKEMHKKAKEMQVLLENIDGPVNAAKFLVDHFAII
ncbi:glycosyltransferase [Bacillus cereus]|uniref:Glycosyl transferase n=1 Tax=Bacillus cereus TaxID=1396 RepID=A0A2A8R2E8_BACCE|nr:glycosyl transferase [Bacillus cereus]PEX80695.1 glycosyl transferase [Bacillus cereus]PFN28490.1 glycosyl transferase [Bacillus cereus]